jgi:hypothetical protein
VWEPVRHLMASENENYGSRFREEVVGGRETARLETGTETRPSVGTKTGLWIRYDVNHSIVKHFSVLWISSSFIMFCNEIRIYE